MASSGLKMGAKAAVVGPKPTVKATVAKPTTTPKLSTSSTSTGSIAKPTAVKTTTIAATPAKAVVPNPNAKPNEPIGSPKTAINPVTGKPYTDIQQEILAKQMPEVKAATASAAKTSPKAAPASTVVPATPASVDDEATQILKDSEKNQKEIDTLKTAAIDGEEEYKDVLMTSAENAYNAEQNNLTKLEELNQKALEAKNAAATSAAENERRDADAALKKSQAELDTQRLRTEKAYKDQILEQKANNLKRELQKESFIAASGGYGSLIKNKELTELTVENDRLINDLVFNKDTADREVSTQITDLHTTYKNDLFQIESEKSNAVTQNYNDYLGYVAEIQNDRELSENQKYDRIATAQAQYKQNVAAISQAAFEQKYNISQTAAEQARTVKETAQTNAKAIMSDLLGIYAKSDSVEMSAAQKKALNDLEVKAGYPVGTAVDALEGLKKEAKAANLKIESFSNDNGDTTFVAVDQTTGEIVRYETLEGLDKATANKYQVQFNPLTGEQIIFDPIAGKVVSGGGSGNTTGFSTAGGQQPPAGTQLVGGSAVSDQDFRKIFNIGGIGGWCGNFATTISTASTVGDSWSQKINKVTHRTNPQAGDKIVLPIGVKSDKVDYGHVAVVTNYDPVSGLISVVESNKNGEMNNGTGPGHITAGTYNLNELKKNYGQNFGFISGVMKPSIQNKLTSSAVTSQQSNKSYQDIVNEQLAGGAPLKTAMSIAEKRIAETDPLAIQKNQAEQDDKAFEKSDKLRDEFNGRPTVKDFLEVKDKVTDVKRIVDSGLGGPGDLAIVYQFMKALDPNSVVREAEYESAANSGNIFAGQYNKFNKGYFDPEGGLLTDQVKQDFLKIVQGSLKTKTKSFQTELTRYNNLADKAGVDRDFVTEDYSVGVDEILAPSQGPSAPPTSLLNIQIGNGGKNVRVKNIQTGETGYIPESEMDANIYQPI